MTTFEQAVAGLSASDLLALANAALQRRAALAVPEVVSDREQAGRLIESCAGAPFAIPQWTTADGRARGVRVQALSTLQRRDASRAAFLAASKAVPVGFVRTLEGGSIPDPWATAAREEYARWLLVCEEAARMIVEPAGLTAETLLKWNAEVVNAIHSFGTTLAGYAPAIIRAELAGLVGIPHPADATEPPAAGSTADGDGTDLADSPEPGDEPAA